jgi:ABC-type lipoprotein release transport system permease subunit
MKTIMRGFRGMSRSPIRTSLLTVLLAVSLSMALVMLVVSNAFGVQIDKIRSEVGTDIYLRPSETLPGESNTMPQDDVVALSGVPEIQKIGLKLNMPFEDSNLKPAELSEESKKVLGQRGMDSDMTTNAASTMDILLIGSNTPDSLNVRGRVTTGLGVVIQPSQNVVITEGRTFTTDEMNANVAVISQSLATSNGFSVGGTLDIYGTSAEIIGTFTADAGDLFGQNAIFLPLETAQNLLGVPGQITEAVIWADDVDNVEQVTAAIAGEIPNPNLTTNVQAFDELAGPLQNARQGSQTGMITSLAACVVIILFAMFLTVRGRMKEIGILKAVGASNADVILQFAVETLVIGLIAAIIGGVVTYFFAGDIASSMVTNQAVEGITGAAQMSVAVSPAVFGYALVIAVVLALIGSCIPAWSVARIKPAEVLRCE